jgi:nicotinamidase-related amidase
MLIDPNGSCLLIIDIQERLLPSMAHAAEVIANAGILLKSARRLGVPVLASEQYPRGLGRTVPEIAALLPNAAVMEKNHFSCMADDDFRRRYREVAPVQAVVAGIEAHVCVLQTVEQLLAEGDQVFVVADGVSSRTGRNHQLALERMRSGGAAIVSAEMVVFEWLRRAGTPEFKELSALIK